MARAEGIEHIDRISDIIRNRPNTPSTLAEMWTTQYAPVEDNTDATLAHNTLVQAIRDTKSDIRKLQIITSLVKAFAYSPEVLSDSRLSSPKRSPFIRISLMFSLPSSSISTILMLPFLSKKILGASASEK